MEEVEVVVVTSPLLPTPLIVSLSSTITATAEARPVRARAVRKGGEERAVGGSECGGGACGM